VAADMPNCAETPGSVPAHMLIRLGNSQREDALENELPPSDIPTPSTESVPLTAAFTPVAEPPTLPDRSTALVVFGVFQIILGLMAALMVPFTALGAFMSRLAPGGGTMRPGQFVSGTAVYAFAAAALLCLGIGSAQVRRWAHALTLVLSWYWLFSGILITVLLTAVLPVTMRSILNAQQNSAGTHSSPLSTGAMAVILTIIIVFAAVFLVLVPIAFLVFYSRKDVAETCRRRDPVVRWNERTPLPVLGASVVLAFQALYLILTGVTTPLFPFFGHYVYGAPTFGCFLVTAAVDAYIAIALFHLKPAGWWVAMITLPIRLISMALTYSRADLMEAYSRMGFSQQQLQLLNSNPITHSHVILWWSLLSTVLLYLYLLWLKRYFRTSARGPQPEMLPV
jgi:hypothetical protein